MKTTAFRAYLGFVFLFAAGSAATESPDALEYCLSGICLGDSAGQHEVHVPERVKSKEQLYRTALESKSFCGYIGPIQALVGLADDKYLQVIFGGDATSKDWQGYRIVGISRDYPDVVVTQLEEWESMVQARYPNTMKTDSMILVDLRRNEGRLNLEPGSQTAIYSTFRRGRPSQPKLVLYDNSYTKFAINQNQVPECVKEKENPLALD